MAGAQPKAPPTFKDGLGELLQVVASLMALPDANIEFLAQMQAQTVAQIHTAGQQGQQIPGAPPETMAGGSPTPAPPGTPGLMQGPPPPNPGELQRLSAGAPGAA